MIWNPWKKHDDLKTKFDFLKLKQLLFQDNLDIDWCLFCCNLYKVLNRIDDIIPPGWNPLKIIKLQNSGAGDPCSLHAMLHPLQHCQPRLTKLKMEVSSL